jgi:lysophospholipase L1-like esterase
MGLRRCFLRTGLALSSALVALLCAEGAARLVGFGAPPRPQRQGEIAFEPVADPSLQYVNRPDCRFETVYAWGDRRGPLVVRGTTTALGVRVPEPARERTPAVRIACLGDSYTFGEGVGDAETWPAQLATALARVRPGESFEVLNCGVNAYDTRQEVRLLETRVLPMQPDLVLLAFFLNDAAIRGEGESVGFEYGSPSALYRALTAQEPACTLRDWSRLADGLADRIVRYEYLVFLGESRSLLYSQDSPGWRAARAELVRARDLCAQHDIGFAVLLYPLLFRREGELASHGAYEIVAQHCRAHDIALLDLEPAFADLDVGSLRVHPTDAHPNAQAHGIAAGSIAAWLDGGDLLRRR